MDLYIPPGDSGSVPLPLDRFLPPLDSGVVTRLLENLGIDGGVVLDPFGASPRLAVETAAAGCTVLVSCANPILQFLTRHTGQPFKKEELQAALTRLGNLPKDDARLEEYLNGLYKSRCEHCGAEIFVDAYLWLENRDAPSYKMYTCSQCNYEGETAAGIEDARLIRELDSYRRHREMVLARIAPPGDPYRGPAAEALDIYTSRAQIVIDVLLTKLDQLRLDPPLDQAVRALVLTTLDRCASLWSYPHSSRPRPKQLSLSPRYYEFNAWQALLWSVERWTIPDVGVEVVNWEPGNSLEQGKVHLYAGSVRDLQPALAEISPLQVISILPRPNRAFWSLSVLWSIWIFGKGALNTFKRSMLKRRVDWHWYAGGLKTVLRDLKKQLVSDRPSYALLFEAEPAFLGASFAGFKTSGMASEGFALHEDSQQAVCVWLPEQPVQEQLWKTGGKTLRAFMIELLQQRGEPASYTLLTGAAQAWLAGPSVEPVDLKVQAGDFMNSCQKEITALLEDRNTFQRLDQNLELERGLFWLKESGKVEEPLSDRVEKETARILMEQERISQRQLLDMVYRQFPYNQIPERKLVHLCAKAYAIRKEDVWYLREEEHPDRREADYEDITTKLWALGQRLGFQVQDTGEILWLDDNNLQVRSFLVSRQASLGVLLEKHAYSGFNLVVPGSRSPLILERLRRDPRLKKALDSGLRILKYRQVRRMSVDPAVQKGNFETYLDLDPLEHQDPQIRLL